MARALMLLMLASLAGIGESLAAESETGRVLHACEVEEGYPPFAFPGPDGRARGYTIDLLNEALEGTGSTLDVVFMPTSRCEALADEGAMDLLLEDDWRPDRLAAWEPSDSIFEGVEVLYYDRERHPDGLDVTAIRARPDAHPGCGILGYSYDAEGFQPGQLELATPHYAQTLDMLLAGRCDFFPELLIVGAAYIYRGLPLNANPRIGRTILRHRPIEGRLEKYDPGDREPLYVHVRRSLPGSEDLITRIDDTIARWRQSGRQEKVLDAYLGGWRDTDRL